MSEAKIRQAIRAALDGLHPGETIPIDDEPFVGFDSLDGMELLMELEYSLKISIDEDSLCGYVDPLAVYLWHTFVTGNQLVTYLNLLYETTHDKPDH